LIISTMENNRRPAAARRTRLKKTALFCVGAIVVGAAFLWTGWPQDTLCSYLLSRALGARARVDGVSLLSVGRLRIDEAQIYDVDEKEVVPTFRARNIDLRYAPFDKGNTQFGPRYIPTLRAESVAGNVRYLGPDNTNCSFLLNMLDATDSGTDAMSFIPQTLHVDDAEIDVTSRIGTQGIRGVSLDGDFLSPDRLKLEIQGQSVNVYLEPGTEEDMAVTQSGSVELTLERDTDTLLVHNAAIDLPGLVELRGTGRARFLHDATVLDADVRKLLLHGRKLSQIAGTFLPQHTRFDTVSVHGAHIQGASVGKDWSTGRSRLSGTVEGLVIGEHDGDEYFKGNLGFNAEGEGREASLEIAFDNDQKLMVMLHDDPLEVRIAIDQWSMEHLENVLPEKFQSALHFMPSLKALSGTAALTGAWPAYAADITLQPVMNGAASLPSPIVLKIKGSGTLSGTDGPLFDGNSTLSLGAEKLEMALRFEAPSLTHLYPLDVAGKLLLSPGGSGGVVDFDLYADENPPRSNMRLALASVDPSHLTVLFGRGSVPGGLETRIAGTVNMNSVRTTSLALDLHTQEFRASGLKKLDGLTISATGAAQISEERDSLTDGSLDLRVPDVGYLRVSGFSATLPRRTSSATVDGTLDLGHVAELLEIDSLSGEMSIRGSAKTDKAQLTVSPSFLVSDLTYKGLGFSDHPIELGGTVELDTETRDARILGVEARIGGHTTWRARELVWAGDRTELSGPFTLATDLTPLVQLGVLKHVSGGSTLTGTLAVGNAGATVNGKLSGKADELALPNDIMVLLGASLEGLIDYSDHVSGRGELYVDTCLVAGATLRKFTCPLEFRETRLVARGAKAELFGGRLQLDSEVGLLGGELDSELDGRFVDINLGAFTEEFNVPGVVMTGVANGRITARLDAEGLHELRVAIRCDRDLTLSRGMVKRLILSGQVEGFTGAKQLSQVMARVLGDQEQRPFDKAELTLATEGESIEGSVLLKSETLNLTIDLNVDPETLVQLLQLRQQEQIEKIDRVRLQSVQ